MKISDLVNETGFSLLMNKARSALTMLGIIIGIASVITLVAVGQGATKTITNNISALGSNLVVIIPGSTTTAGVSQGIGTNQTLKVSDATALQKQMQFVNGISPELSKRYQLNYKSNNTNTTVYGANPVYALVHNVQVSDGTFFDQQQNNTAQRVAVLGPTVAQTLFGDTSSGVGKTIRIGNVSFNVLGIANAKGGSGITSPDNNVFIPLVTAQRYLFGQATSVSSISISAQSSSDISSVQAQASQIMLNLHNISNPARPDFQIVNQTDIASSLSSSSRTLTILLGSIAGISLLVGGIGIMNMMLTTVTERTREIGLRKAVGARKRDIGNQFLSEAIVLTIVGGLCGIAIGLLSAVLLNHFNLVTTVLTWWSIVLAFGVSMLIGVMFGYYPANRAARLKPIDALKYE